MKKHFFIFVALLISVLNVNAQSWTPIIYQAKSSLVNTSSRYQRAYFRKDGTFVKGHMKTRSNRTNHDNFSTSYNVNSFTGSVGTRARDYSPRAYNYGSGRTVYTGSRGGQYYINSRGNKTYIPKRR